ncbi:MAG: hypothetical protein JW955_10300, partial [Sedimentisphaerales bacterium]|nr:hypothetical protein [Sedimentisphaerales bacterium]
KYLRSSGENLGFRSAKGCCVNTLEPMIPRQEQALVSDVGKASAGFYRELMRPTPPPSFFRLMAFRIARSRIKALDDTYKDYRHYRERGWFESDYYHETSLGPVKKLAGSLFDFVGRHMARRAEAG